MPDPQRANSKTAFWQLLGIQVADRAPDLRRQRQGAIQIELQSSAGPSEFRYVDVRPTDATLVEGVCGRPAAWLEISPKGLERFMSGDAKASQYIRLLGDAVLARQIFGALDASKVEWMATGGRR